MSSTITRIIIKALHWDTNFFAGWQHNIIKNSRFYIPTIKPDFSSDRIPSTIPPIDQASDKPHSSAIQSYPKLKSSSRNSQIACTVHTVSQNRRRANVPKNPANQTNATQKYQNRKCTHANRGFGDAQTISSGAKGTQKSWKRNETACIHETAKRVCTKRVANLRTPHASRIFQNPALILDGSQSISRPRNVPPSRCISSYVSVIAHT